MDPICYEYLKEYFKEANVVNKRILEVGSFIVGGQESLNLRQLTEGSEFTGIDMREGPGVDVVANSHELPFVDEEFDLIINYNTLEHDDKPFKSMKEMDRCLKKDGVLLTSTPCYFYIHGYPDDYFRYTPSGVRNLGKAFEHAEIVAFGHPYFPQQVFGMFSHDKITVKMDEFVEQYTKNLKPKLYMDLRNFLRYLKVDMTKKVFRVVV